MGVLLGSFGIGVEGRGKGASLIDQPKTLNAKTCPNAIANRALAGDAAKLLLSSVAGDTQMVYLEGWKWRTRFCESGKISPYVNSSLRNWGRDVLCFFTW